MTHKTRALIFFCGILVLFAGIVSASESHGDTVSHYSSGREVNPLYAEEMSLFEKSLTALAESEEDILTPSEFKATLPEAAEELRVAMVERTNSIVLGYRTTTAHDSETLAREIFSMAVAHSGVPTEGDYLAWQWKDRNINARAEHKNGAYYFTFSYYINYYTTPQMEAELSLEVEKLLDELDLYHASDYEKIRGIYDYICTNVQYDHTHANQSSYTLKYTAYAALVNKTAVCQGYAVLFYRLAAELGLDSRIIFGKAGSVNHTWMIVRLGDTYFNLDPTWDAGKESYLYFLKGEANFLNHKRLDNALCGMYYTSPPFFAAYPMAKNDFSAAVIPDYALYGTCGEDLRWTLGEDGRLVIYGSGPMADYDSAPAPWSEYAPFVREIVIASGVSSIGASAFDQCTAVETVALPDSVTHVGENAFGDIGFYYPEKAPISLRWDSPSVIASSPDGRRYLLADLEHMDIISLISELKAETWERFQVVSADGSARYVGSDTVELGARVQRLDENGGVTDEVTVALWGDFNLDGVADESDVVFLLWSFVAPEKYGYVPQYDLNGDTLINASDAAYAHTRADE